MSALDTTARAVRRKAICTDANHQRSETRRRTGRRADKPIVEPRDVPEGRVLSLVARMGRRKTVRALALVPSADSIGMPQREPPSGQVWVLSWSNESAGDYGRLGIRPSGAVILNDATIDLWRDREPGTKVMWPETVQTFLDKGSIPRTSETMADCERLGVEYWDETRFWEQIYEKREMALLAGDILVT